MPYSIRLPDGTLVDNIPDDLNPLDAKRRIIAAYPQFAPETTILGQAGEAVKGLVPGAIGLIETGVAGASALLPEEYEEAVRAKTKEIATAAKKPFEASIGYEDTVGRKLGEAIGSTIPFLAAGPFGLAGRAAAVGLGTAAGAGEARTRAEAEGATAEQRAAATGYGIIPGAAEAFAPLRILGRLGDDIVGGGVSYVKRALVAGGEEAAQEAASGFAQNLIAKGIYKPEQELIEGLGEQAAYGGATGAIVQGLLDLAIGRRARGPAAPAEPTAEAPPAEPVVTNYQTIDQAGNPTTISVAQDDTGTIVATGPDGEPIDLSNMVSAGFTVEDSIKSVFSAHDAPVVPAAAAPEPQAIPEIPQEIQQAAPEITPPAPPPPPIEIGPTFAEEAPDFEGVEMKAVEQPPLPLPEQITALDKDAERVVKDIKSAEKQRKGESLAGALRNKLNDSELYDIFGTEAPSYFKSGKKSGEGKTIADALADGDLDAFVPDNLIVYKDDSPETVMDKQMETVGYIKDKLRNKNYLTASTEAELQRLNFNLKGIEDSLELEMTDEQIRQEANALAAEIAAEQGLSPVEATAEEGAVGDTRKLPIKAAAERVTPQVGDIISSRPLPNNMEARVFKTTDGYGASLYDKDSGNVVSGSVTRYKGTDAQARAESYATELSTKATPVESKKGAPPELPVPAGFKPKKGRKPQVVMAARLLEKGEITKDQYDQYVNYYMPINPIPEGVLESPIDDAVMRDILVNKIRSKKDPDKVNAPIADGTRVGLRMDIPALEWGQENGVNGSVVSIHKGKKPDSASAGENISYKSAGALKNVKFAIRNEGRAFNVAKQVEPEKATTKEGKEVLKDEASKTPQQTMEGEWVNMDPAKVFALIKEKMQDPAWSQISMDPLRHSYFYDRDNKQPVIEASEVLQVGRFVLAKDVKYADRNEFLYLTAPKGVSGNSKKAVDEVINMVKQKWTNVPEINVVQSVSELPKYLRDQMERDGVNPKGAFHPSTKTIFIVADNIVGTRDAILTVAHEAIGHFGLRSILGANLDKVMLNLYATNDQVRVKADKKIASGLNKITAVEEVLAEAVEERVGPDTALGKALQIIRNLIRRAFQAVGVKTLNDLEIQGLLDRSRDYVVGNIETIEEVSDQGLTTEEKAIADRERELFALQPQVPEKVGAPTGDLFGGEGLQQIKPTKQLKTQISDDQASLFRAGERGKKAKPTPTAEGQAALDTINDLGRQVEETPTMRQKAREYWDNATDNPQATKEAAKKATVRFLDKIETYVFNSDAAINNSIRRLINETTMSEQEKMGILLSISSSQAVHPDALANLFIRYGGLNYDPSIYKYVAVDKKDNFVSLVQGIDTIGSKYGLTKEQAERVSHTAFEAKRLSSIARFNRALKVEIDDLRDMARTASDPTARDLASKEVRRKVKDFKFVHMTDEQIQRGLELFNTIPELNALVDTWNGIRENSRKELVESGLWSEQEAEGLLSNMDYVPFYREDQLEKGKGPKEFLRNLQVQAKEKKLKGSDKPVADIFDNMARWTQYAVKRSVMNRLALAKIDAAVEMGIAKKVEKQTQGDNSVRVWRNGEAEYYSLDDPLFMEAFTGLESVAIPSLKYFAKLSNLLRQSVVLYPLFSVSQVPQDAFAAMFSSGLKTRFALTIPARAAKEFVKTLFKSSQTHKELERIGVVGIRDFTAQIAREDAEIYAGLKARPGVLNKVKSLLEHVAMASDNAVRQAVYEASIAQGTSRAEAIEKAFNLINFRNRGSSKELAIAGQVIPFFNAYLAAQHVAYRTISGVGISPTERKAALGTLAATTASVMALSLIYAMLIGDDEDYLNKPSVMRDRLFMIPGTGITIPIRSDIFSIPKIVTEHMYMLMTDNGASDGRKFRDSMKAALGNALLSPTVFPQAIKPLFEVGINYNFFQGRPLVGTYQQGLETARQFNDSTSELAKLFGQTGVISPISADHLIRGMLGSVGGLTLYMTNFALHNDPEVPRPAMSAREAIAALPGTSGFISKEYETALKNDFYVLRDEVSTAVNTLNDLKKRSPHEIEEFLADETNLTRVGMAKAVNRITKNLTDIRRAISQITASDQMSASEKAEQIRELKTIEREILQNVDLKSLREMANL